MAKRFIDTDLFDDEWFMDLSLSGKVFWMYCITKCDHAGILELNNKLAQFQTGIKNIQTVIKELGNRLISVNERYYFIPKYIEFQYPGFPNSKVRQQASAVEILKKFNLFDNTLQTVIKELTNSYDNDNDNDNGSENGKEPSYKKFYREQWELSKGHPLASKYHHIIKYLMNLDENIIADPGEHILKLKKQLAFEDFAKLHDYVGKRQTSIKEMIDSWLNKPSYSNGKVSVYAVLRNWATKAPIQGTNFGESKSPLINSKIGKR